MRHQKSTRISFNGISIGVQQKSLFKHLHHSCYDLGWLVEKEFQDSFVFGSDRPIVNFLSLYFLSAPDISTLWTHSAAIHPLPYFHYILPFDLGCVILGVLATAVFIIGPVDTLFSAEVASIYDGVRSERY